MEYVRNLGNRMQRTGLDTYPTGEQLAAAYDRKSVGILRAVKAAVVPGFWEAYNLGQTSTEVEDQGEAESLPELWSCPKCAQRFPPAMAQTHSGVCTVSKRLMVHVSFCTHPLVSIRACLPAISRGPVVLAPIPLRP
jgi:hypothetical protein